MKARVLPLLLLHDGALVKSVRFDDLDYIGDPVNAVRIFNELEVDELVFLDILATPGGRQPEYDLIEQIAGECFMPLAYGGGIRSSDQAARLFGIGIEKITVNSAALADPGLIDSLASAFGSQSIVAAMDVLAKRNDRHEVVSERGRRPTGRDAVEWARELEGRGAGEVLLNSVARDGTWQGIDLDLVSRVSGAVDLPVIACGGAGNLQHVAAAVDAGAQAVAAGSLFVYQKKGFGVLISYPTRTRLNAALESSATRQ